MKEHVRDRKRERERERDFLKTQQQSLMRNPPIIVLTRKMKITEREKKKSQATLFTCNKKYRIMTIKQNSRGFIGFVRLTPISLTITRLI